MAFSSFIQNVFGIKASDLDFEISVDSRVLELKGRIDAVFGNIIIEFKRDLKKSLDVAQDELKKYFQAYREKFPDSKFIGIANDGILFKVYQPIFKNDKIFEIEKIGEINLESATIEEIFNWFDSFFFSLPQITPTSEHIKQTFGLNSPTYAVVRQELRELFDKVKEYKPIITKYENWSRYLEIVYGDKPNEINLFIAHTYLSTFAKLLVYLKLTSKEQFRSASIPPIIYGNIFSQFGIRNYVEEDFFSWIMFVGIRKSASKIFEKILKDLEIYDLDQMNEDVLKELYQEMVNPVVRKQLGEFYTPDWLAEKIVEDVLKKDPTKSVLDPSCGSGTFLFKTIRYKIVNLEKNGMEKSEILSHILKKVIGFDIHPLAALIAKTNYLLALRDIIHSRKGTITLPVYLSDSLKIPAKKMEVINAVTTFEFDTKVLDKKFSFPTSITEDVEKMDDIIEKMKEHGNEFEDKVRIIRDSGYKTNIDDVSNNFVISFEKAISPIKNENEKEILIQNLKTLFELIKEEFDSIWPYILRNMYKPISISHVKVDIVIGNPPWLAMQFMKNEHYQNYLKERSKNYGLVDIQKSQNITHLELATLFFCQCIDQYLNDGGVIAFVMPKSVLVSSHHENFLKFKKPICKIFNIYDLENVNPLFKIPCCVIIGKKGIENKYPVPNLQFKGKLPKINCQLQQAESNLTIKEAQYSPYKHEMKYSYYYEEFFEGATIVPRNFYFMDIEKHPLLGFDPMNPQVVSSEKNLSKFPWNTLKMNAQVESIFLYGTILGDDLVPFGIRKFRLVVLPIITESGKITMITDYSGFQTRGYPKASNYFKKVEQLWNKNATEKSKKMSPYQRLNFRNGLTKQDPQKKFKVLYVSSSTYLAACVIDTHKELISSDGNKIKLTGFIAESKTYCYETNSKPEAHYLSAILNSKVIDDKIKPMQTRGLWGARDIHRRPLMFPIPRFELKNMQHVKLSELSEKCSNKIPKLLEKLMIKDIGKIRSSIRNKLTEIDEINSIVKQLINPNSFPFC